MNPEKPEENLPRRIEDTNSFDELYQVLESYTDEPKLLIDKVISNLKDIELNCKSLKSIGKMKGPVIMYDGEALHLEERSWNERIHLLLDFGIRNGEDWFPGLRRKVFDLIAQIEPERKSY